MALALVLKWAQFLKLPPSSIKPLKLGPWPSSCFSKELYLLSHSGKVLLGSESLISPIEAPRTHFIYVPSLSPSTMYLTHPSREAHVSAAHTPVSKLLFYLLSTAHNSISLSLMYLFICPCVISQTICETNLRTRTTE